MRIARVHIQNFRSILDQVIELDRLTVVVGPNGAGKSAVLRALDAFYDPRFNASVDDFYNRKTDAPIRIAVRYSDLSDDERTEYGRHAHDDGTLTVTRVLTTNSNKYHGASKQFPGFRTIRATEGKRDKLNAYKAQQEQDGFQTLATLRAADGIEEQLQAWESANPDRCEVMEDDGQFFGFHNVGSGKLEKFTRFLLVPAVREADREAIDSKGSAIHQLIELVVRNSLAQSPELQSFREATQQEYARLVSPENVPQLQTLARELSDQLHHFVPTANVLLEWMAADQLTLPLPKAAVQLEEDGFKAPVSRVGHGLQRAFILSLLQRLAAGATLPTTQQDTAQQTQPADRLPNLILAIEEPELYQHPNRQRQLARVLRQLSEGTVAGVADRTQVLYCTHSPLFVELPAFDRVRRLSKTPHPNWDAGDEERSKLPRVTTTAATTLQAVADLLSNAQDQGGQPFTAVSLKARMTALMTPWMNEGFFADCVVLVEGEDDRAAIVGTAKHLHHDLESAGVAVIPCGGKTNIDRPLVAFRALGIPAYVVFDGDADCPTNERADSSERNRSLQRLLGVDPPVDFPADGVFDTYAVYQDTLEKILQSEAGQELFLRVLSEFKTANGFKKHKQALKNPAFAQQLLTAMPPDAVANGTLKKIVDRIWALAQNRHAQLTVPQGAANGT